MLILSRDWAKLLPEADRGRKPTAEDQAEGRRAAGEVSEGSDVAVIGHLSLEDRRPLAPKRRLASVLSPGPCFHPVSGSEARL